MIWILSLVFSMSLTTAAPKVVMAVLVKVDKTALTSRDLQINQFLNEYDNVLTGYVDKREPLKEMVWEYLLGVEAENLLSNEDIARDYPEYERKFFDKYAGDKMWKGLEASRSEVKSLLSRRFAAKKLIHLKIPTELIDISQQELEAYYMQNRFQLGHRPLEEIKDKLQKGLREKKAQVRLKDWVNAVSRSHTVVYMSGFRIQ
jgi:hypothetical protein